MRGEGVHARASFGTYPTACRYLGNATQTHTIARATPTTAARLPSRGTYLGPCPEVRAVLQQRLHHPKMPVPRGDVQAGRPDLEIRRAVSGGATAIRAASAGRDALPRGAPVRRKHKLTAAGSRKGALPCYAPYTPMHAHPWDALSDNHTQCPG